MPRWTDDQARRRWARPGVAAAAFLLVAVVAGALAVFWPGRATTAAPTQAASVPASTPPAVPAPVLSSSTPPGADQTVPRVGPPVTWVQFKTLALPVSAAAGPRVNTGTVMSGYQRTPAGALLAVADNDVRFSLADDWRTATLAAVADTPGRAAFIAQRAPYGQLADPIPGQLTQIAGFNVVSYTPDRATIQIARVATDGGVTATTDTVRWEAGDWKVLLPDSGTTPPAAVLRSLAGYVPWSSS